MREMGRQVYLGGYEHAEHAAEAYDVAALKCKGFKVKTNFDIGRQVLNCLPQDKPFMQVVFRCTVCTLNIDGKCVLVMFCSAIAPVTACEKLSAMVRRHGLVLLSKSLP